jgi:hypothetical protein
MDAARTYVSSVPPPPPGKLSLQSEETDATACAPNLITRECVGMAQPTSAAATDRASRQKDTQWLRSTLGTTERAGPTDERGLLTTSACLH